uniref:hypothetical protein n=1 Tax=Thaumasiovibrio occultus TaxID=1891184 RepID=UPI00131E9D3D|nr:hypothetical protein [Thaumasiovibrio occultus]
MINHFTHQSTRRAARWWKTEPRCCFSAVLPTATIRLSYWLVALVLCSLPVKAYHYDLAELEQLDQHEQWIELTTHLADIPPTERDARWTLLAQHAGQGYAMTVTALYSREQVTQEVLALLQNHPFLLDEMSFMDAMLEIITPFYRPCFAERRQGCVRRYAELLATVDVDSELSYREGERAYQYLAPSEAIPFFSQAVDERGYCRDPKISTAVLETLAQGHSDYHAQALWIATQACNGIPLHGVEQHLKQSVAVQEALCRPYLDALMISGVTGKVCELAIAR